MWEIIGQTRAVSILQRGLEQGAGAHAFMFVGPAHLGKMTLALNLARALDCTGEVPPCGQCPSCLKIFSGRHSDVMVLDLSHNEDGEGARQKTEISVLQVEEAQHAASLPPFEGKYKVFIIDGAELLSLGAANRLLKTLEEPAENVVFILLTSNQKLLPETVVSRCQVIELAPVSPDEIEESLYKNHSVPLDQAQLLARLSHGCPGWAVTAADNEKLLQQRDEWLDRQLGVCRGDLEEKFAYAGQLATQFGRDRASVQERLNLWLDWWRDMMLVKTGTWDNVTNIDRQDQVAEMASAYSLADIRQFIESIRKAGDRLRQNANPKLVLEVLMLDMPGYNKQESVRNAV